MAGLVSPELVERSVINMQINITNIINLSVFTGILPDQHSHLKKSHLDKDDFAKYHPVSVFWGEGANLGFLQ